MLKMLRVIGGVKDGKGCSRLELAAQQMTDDILADDCLYVRHLCIYCGRKCVLVRVMK